MKMLAILRTCAIYIRDRRYRVFRYTRGRIPDVGKGHYGK